MKDIQLTLIQMENISHKMNNLTISQRHSWICECNKCGGVNPNIIIIGSEQEAFLIAKYEYEMFCYHPHIDTIQTIQTNNNDDDSDDQMQ